MASSLASSVANLLGIPLDAAKQRLTQAFTTALAPAGTGPPQTNAERASALVQRFRQIAELATRVTNGDPGQPIRLIAGQRSDAEQAGATPAPTTDQIIRDAAQALAGSASPVPIPSATTTSSAAPVAPATASDGRSVALAPAQAVATGGDTPLGRILARASRAGEQPVTPVASPVRLQPETLPPESPDLVATAASSLTRTSSLTATAVPDAPAAQLTPATPIRAALPARTMPATTAPTAPPDPNGSAKTLDAFVKAFTAAVTRDDALRATTATDAPAISSPSAPQSLPTTVAPAHVVAAVDTSQPIAPFAVPTAPDVSAVQPPAPAPTLPHTPQVDANAVVDQVLRGVSLRTTDGSSEVKLRLVPESLGDVSVKLVVTGGSVDATITTHSADTQNLLAGAQHQLAKTLADAGLKLQSFSVGLAGGSFADARDRQQAPTWSNRSTRRVSAVGETDADEAVDPALLAIPSYGPSIYSANPLHGDFSYLA